MYITVKSGDNVTLLDDVYVSGIIDEIDKTLYQFTLKEYDIWFDLRDVKILNGEEINNDLLIF